jgi:hypothetical protein
MLSRCLLLFIFIVGANEVLADAYEKTQSTLDPLKVGVRLPFGAEMRNVRDAAIYLLEPTGYRITANTVDTQALNSILSRPITPLAKNGETVSIQDALLLMIGTENRLVVDHHNKLVTFEHNSSKE